MGSKSLTLYRSELALGLRMRMLHSNGRAPQLWKHSVAPLLSSKLNRAVADISAGVPTDRQIGLTQNGYH
jgi:hypothetical protein